MFYQMEKNTEHTLPDFERIIDELSIHINKKDPKTLEYTKGFIAGKKYARKEIVFIIGSAIIIYSIFKMIQYF